MDVINFYSVSEKYGCFSNFSPHSIKLDGKTWPTSEHYFQAMKFVGSPDEEEVRLAKSPMIAARMGRSRKRPLRKDWESVKNRIMHEAVLAKFSQHADLREILLGTGDAKIVEHTENDDYWGDGGDGSGKNKLGQILMQVREELRGRGEAEGGSGRGYTSPWQPWTDRLDAGQGHLRQSQATQIRHGTAIRL
jgi:N-glycosidase YbiA